MREHNSSSNQEQHPGSHQTEETNEARKARIQKNRAIRKQKLAGRIIVEQVQPIPSSMTKQARVQLQKVKNRQAAQRSREQRKLYIQAIEQQIQQLKKKLSQPKYCSKCNLLLNNNSTSIDSETFHLEEQKNVNIQNEEQIQFIRLQGHQDISPMNFFLFVALVFTCVLMPVMDLQNQSVHDDLAYLSKSRLLYAVNQPDVPINENLMEIQNGIVPINYQFPQFMPGTCLKQIIEDANNTVFLQEPNIYLHTQIPQPSNTFVCEKPKIYRRPSSANIFSKFIDIIVSGREVREIIKNDRGYQLRQVELDGLYSLKTEVRQIIRLDYLENCLN